jgi:reverse gyrase
MENEEEEEDSEDDVRGKTYTIPEYAKFDTSIGDEYNSCCKVIETTGLVFTVSDLGKKVTEELCKILRREGFKADWHAVKNTVTVKTLETGDRMLSLKSRWRQLVKQYASGDLKIR